MIDTLHQFRGYHSDGGVCRIEVYLADGKPPLVVATELLENTNTSITNLAEYLAAEVMERYLTAEDLAGHEPPIIWVEKYERDLPTLRALGRQYDPDSDDWSIVTFEHYRREQTRAFSRPPAWRYRIGEPDWRHISAQDAEALIGSYRSLEEVPG